MEAYLSQLADPNEDSRADWRLTRLATYPRANSPRSAYLSPLICHLAHLRCPSSMNGIVEVGRNKPSDALEFSFRSDVAYCGRKKAKNLRRQKLGFHFFVVVSRCSPLGRGLAEN